MICKFCGDNYEAMTEYCDCSAKPKELYAHAVVDVVIPSDDFRASIKGMFEGKTLVDTVALHAFIQSRERKAYHAAWSYGGDASIEDYDKCFNDYLESDEYKND